MNDKAFQISLLFLMDSSSVKNLTKNSARIKGKTIHICNNDNPYL